MTIHVAAWQFWTLAVTWSLWVIVAFLHAVVWTINKWLDHCDARWGVSRRDP